MKRANVSVSRYAIIPCNEVIQRDFQFLFTSNVIFLPDLIVRFFLRFYKCLQIFKPPTAILVIFGENNFREFSSSNLAPVIFKFAGGRIFALFGTLRISEKEP